MLKTTQKFVPLHREDKVTYGRKNGKKFITVHDTGNKSKGADAEMHSRLQFNGNSRAASWHWQVDDHEAIQSFPHITQCWAAGDGRGDGNLNSIHVEICINEDGDYNKAVENGAELVRMIMELEGIPVENVKQHYDWSKKDCPKQMRANKNGISWSYFLNMVQEKEQESKVDVVVDKDNLYRVQVGAFANKENAEALAKELKAKGYPIYIPETTKLNVSTSSSKPKPKPKTVEELAQEVLANKHGDGADRRKSLGDRYAEVQKRVDEIVQERERKATVIEKGDKVKIKTTAKKYSTGENIPKKYKGKEYTADQVTDEKVLIKEIYSWVNKDDLVKS